MIPWQKHGLTFALSPGFIQMFSKKPTAGIILAAGMSTRIGRPKQLLPLKGKALISWVLEAALNSRLEEIILVLGHEHHTISEALGLTRRHPRLKMVVNRHYREGLSTSLRAGLRMVNPKYNSVMFLLADQPLIDSAVINKLLERFWRSKKEICVPVCEGRRRNPAIFSRCFFESLLNIKGDQGARSLIEDFPERVLAVPEKNCSFFYDIDTEDDLERLKALGAFSS
jgi:molybdenum cofactor cytidylyltransferase